MHNRHACLHKAFGEAGRQCRRCNNYAIDRIGPQHADGIGRINLVSQIDKQWAQSALLQAAREPVEDIQKTLQALD